MSHVCMNTVPTLIPNLQLKPSQRSKMQTKAQISLFIGRAGSRNTRSRNNKNTHETILSCQWGVFDNFCAPPYSSELFSTKQTIDYSAHETYNHSTQPDAHRGKE